MRSGRVAFRELRCRRTLRLESPAFLRARTDAYAAMAEVAHGSLAIELGESSCSTPDDASEMAVSALCHGLRGLSTTVPSGSVRLPLRQLLEDVRIASSLAALKLRARASPELC